MSSSPTTPTEIAVIGGGPAGLMAAEVISGAGYRVAVYDTMPSVGRKFLMAGKSGLNLTHSEDFELFLKRFGLRARVLEPMLRAFAPQAIRDWAAGLGVSTFVGSSGRVFPAEMKAAPLLRAWIRRLRAAGVKFHLRHRWLGFHSQGGLRFDTPTGEKYLNPRATVLALGGGSWSRLGSDGTWAAILQAAGVAIQPLRPANCGFDVTWSEHLRHGWAGSAVKSVSLSFCQANGEIRQQQGEFVLSDYGVEGSLVYQFAAELRDTIEQQGQATLTLDLLPAWSQQRIVNKLMEARGKRSLSEHLRRQLGLSGIKTQLIYELVAKDVLKAPDRLAKMIKALPIICLRPRPLDEAISSAGGVCFSAMDPRLMLNALPGVFCAGEMLDWEAPTGGYLLSACLASGVAAGRGMIKWMANVNSFKTG